jgi:hypothetical protein
VKTVVVTGVSTGIGAAIARDLVRSGYRVAGSVRKASDAERLKAELGDAFWPLVFDVTDEAAVVAAAARTRELLDGERLAGLVNNAGIAVAGPLILQSAEDFRSQIEVNLTGVHLVCRAFAPLLGADRALKGPPGRIINMSSVAGRFAAPFLGAYAAAKHGLEGYSESLRRELMLYGIDVIIIGPGSVATPIWDKAEDEGLGPYAGSDYGPSLRRFSDYMIGSGRKGFAPGHIARLVRKALETARPRTRYSAVPGPLMNEIIPRLLPKRFTDRLLARRIGLTS